MVCSRQSTTSDVTLIADLSRLKTAISVQAHCPFGIFSNANDCSLPHLSIALHAVCLCLFKTVCSKACKQNWSTGEAIRLLQSPLPCLCFTHTHHRIVTRVELDSCSSHTQLHQHCPCESSPQIDEWGSSTIQLCRRTD